MENPAMHDSSTVSQPASLVSSWLEMVGKHNGPVEEGSACVVSREELANERDTRQEAALLIHQLGNMLGIQRDCINSAVVYMHRYFTVHSFQGPNQKYLKNFSSDKMCAACLFLAAKFKLLQISVSSVIRVYNQIDGKSWTPQNVGEDELVEYEFHLLSTIGFQHLRVKHPSDIMQQLCKVMKFGYDLRFASHNLYTNSLQLTAFCVLYKPSIVLCVCINTALKLHSYRMPLSKEKHEWYKHVDNTITSELLDELTNEFIDRIRNCPNKSKVLAWILNTNEAKPETNHVAPRETDISLGALNTRDKRKETRLSLHTEPTSDAKISLGALKASDKKKEIPLSQHTVEPTPDATISLGALKTSDKKKETPLPLHTVESTPDATRPLGALKTIDKKKETPLPLHTEPTPKATISLGALKTSDEKKEFPLRVNTILFELALDSSSVIQTNGGTKEESVSAKQYLCSMPASHEQRKRQRSTPTEPSEPKQQRCH